MDRHQDLKSMITGFFMRTALIPIPVVGVTLLIIYFLINHYVTQRHLHSLEDEVRSHSHDILQRESEHIRARLDEVERIARFLQDEHTLLFARSDEVALTGKTPSFAVSKNGLFYKRDTSGSSLYFSSGAKITDRQRQKAILTEAMDASFESIVTHYPGIVAVYFNSWDNMNRHYPYIAEVYGQVEDRTQNEEKHVYYLADPIHDPQRSPVWTEADQSQVEDAWMLSCVVPIYRDAFLEGVTGLDVTVESVVGEAFAHTPQWGASLFLVDTQGEVLAMSERVKRLSSQKGAQGHLYTDVIKEIFDRQRSDELEDEEDLLNGTSEPFVQESVSEMMRDDETFMVTQHTVDGTGWRLILLIEKETLFDTPNRVKGHAVSAGFAAIALIILSYLAIFYYLRRRGLRLAVQISTPLERLSQKTDTVGTSKMDIHVIESHILEIDRLNQGFVRMIDELHSRTNQMVATEIESKVEEKEVRLYHQRSLTDPMTGLYDRHKADEVIIAEIERFKRYGHSLSFILIDIDLFKHINDAYGREVGDRLLVDLSRAIKRQVRVTDVVARVGGEEFLVITNDTGLEAATLLAEKLRRSFEERRFSVNHDVTVSIGVATYHKGESHTEVLTRVKQALTQAKEEGRNRVVAIS